MKLYTYGSSFTQGMELCDDPDTDKVKIADKSNWLKNYKSNQEILQCERSLAWPQHLANMIGIDCDNRARSGSNNTGIIHNYITDLANGTFDEEDVVIIASTSPIPINYSFWIEGSYHLKPLHEVDQEIYDNLLTTLYDKFGVTTDVIRYCQDLLCIVALSNSRKNTYWMTLPGGIEENVVKFLKWHNGQEPEGYYKMLQSLDKSKHIPCTFTDIVKFFLEEESDMIWNKDFYVTHEVNLNDVHGLCHPKVHKHQELAQNIFNTGVLN